MNFLLFDETNGNLRSGWRVAIFLFCFTAISVFMGTIAQFAFDSGMLNIPRPSNRYLALTSLLSLIPALLVGWLCGRLLEKLPLRSLGVSFVGHWLRNLIYGIVLGTLTLSFAVGIAFVFGGLNFGLNNTADANTIIRSLLVSFVVFGIASAFEEVLFRGYILQTFERSGLAWLAILLTSVFFWVVHYRNPSANLISTANTMLAGVWFSLAYLKTRDLWFVWGLHLMWNWMQGSFFGIEVSGLTDITTAPLLREIDSGPSWLTGQTYGVEGGIVCTIALIASIYLTSHLRLPKIESGDEKTEGSNRRVSTK